MTRIAGKTERNVRTRMVRVSLSLAAALTLLSLSALPAYAWTSTPGATVLSAPTVVLGGSITDNAPLTLTSNGPGTSPASCPAGSTFGCITFNVYSGTCSAHTTLLYTQVVVVTSAAQGSGHTYTSSAFTPGAAGNYIWLDTYSGTTGGYPAATYGCEPFTVNPPSHGVPEFPVGLPALLALALPLMILLRRKLPSQ